MADALGLPVMNYDVSDTRDVIDSIVSEYKGKIVLVVGHSNTIPELMANMGASKNVPAIDEDEYDNLYLVTIPWFGKTKTIRLRYGEPYVALSDRARRTAGRDARVAEHTTQRRHPGRGARSRASGPVFATYSSVTPAHR